MIKTIWFKSIHFYSTDVIFWHNLIIGQKVIDTEKHFFKKNSLWPRWAIVSIICETTVGTENGGWTH